MLGEVGGVCWGWSYMRGWGMLGVELHEGVGYVGGGVTCSRWGMLGVELHVAGGVC